MTTEHPDLVRLRERDRLAREQGYTEGDVNHFLQPVIGMLRRRLQNNHDADLERAVHAMHRACNAELAWLLAKEDECEQAPPYPCTSDCRPSEGDVCGGDLCT